MSSLCHPFTRCRAGESSPVLTNALITLATSSQASLHSLSSSCNPLLIDRLEANTVDASVRVAQSVSTTIGAVQQCVPIFVSNARLHMQAVEKRMQSREEELTGTLKAYEACWQQLSSGAVSSEVEDSVETIRKLFDCIDTFPDVSQAVSVSHAGSGVALACVGTASRIVSAIDAARSSVSHAPWLTRSQTNAVTVTVVDNAGEPVYGVTPSDVRCFVASGAEGWSVASITVESNIVALTVALTANCRETAAIEADVAGTSIAIRLKVCGVIPCLPHTCVHACLFLCRPLRHQM